jgi:hypothetical protein
MTNLTEESIQKSDLRDLWMAISNELGMKVDLLVERLQSTKRDQTIELIEYY